MTKTDKNISDVAVSLKKIVDNSENDFIRLGNYLQNISSDISELSFQTDSAVKIYYGEDENVLEKIKSSTKSVMEKLAKSQERIEGTIPPINDIIESMYSFRSINTRIDEATKYLRSVAFNFIIESTVISENDENFKIIANEVKGLSGKIFDVSAKIKEDSENSLIDFRAASEYIVAGLSEISDLSENSKEIINLSLIETEELVKNSLKIMNTVNETSRNINQDIVEIIVAIQLHDSISQRIEHINKGIEDILVLTKTDKPLNGENYSVDERAALASAVLKIQSSQLENIINDLTRVYSKNFMAFNGIIVELESLTESIRVLEKNTSKGQLIDSLLSSLDQLSSLDDKGKKVRHSINKISDNSSETADRLSVHAKLVEEIGDETHTKALNSIIASHKLGVEGQSLKVLSQEMGEISNKTKEFAGDVSDVLSKVVSHADILKNQSSKGEEQSGEFNISELIDTLKSTSDNLGESLSLALASAEKLTSSITQAMKDLIFFNSMTDGFTENLTGIKKIMEDSEIPDMDVQKFFNDDYFQKRYTMDTERKIHKKVMTGSEEEEDKSLDDNIELF